MAVSICHLFGNRTFPAFGFLGRKEFFLVCALIILILLPLRKITSQYAYLKGFSSWVKIKQLVDSSDCRINHLVDSSKCLLQMVGLD